ncbi:hypothetical protein [Methanobrevibacter sp.]
MRDKRSLLFILILFLIIFSTSFVSASEDLAHDDTNGKMTLSADSDAIETDMLNSVNLDSIEESSDSALGQADDAQNTNEIENESRLTFSDKAPILGASNDEPVLGTDQYLNSGTAQQVIDAIVSCSNSGGGTVYLNGGTYTGEGSINAVQNQQRYISNVRVVGGSPQNPDQKATFTGDNPLTFQGHSQSIPGVQARVNTPWGVFYMDVPGFYSNSGVNLNNVRFENLEFEHRGFAFKSGSLTNVAFNNINSSNHLFFLYGCYWDNTPIPVTNCNFTNCHQTYPGNNPEGGTDGDGQLGAVFGAKITGCNFINTSSATHGGAFCLSDESEWGSQCVASSITDCNFINITSRWFAVYIHGNFSTTVYYNDRPQVVENCKFINCTATGEYGGALGISHNNVIVRNSDFINNTGGQGAAIMVGGINKNHDGFNGRNTQGNNITIDNCNFIGNVAKEEGQSSSTSPDHGGFQDFPTGNAGAIYIYGNDTKILNSFFDANVADSGNGAAVYIFGDRTVIDNSEFYNHESDNGTVYIKGANTEINDSTFKDNTAENGAGVYIVGKNTEISGTDFDSNEASENGAGVYINGDNTKINSESTFENNLAVNGAGVYIEGKNTEISDSTFEYNNATNGGAVYIKGQSSTLSSNTFDHNNVTNQGGAVYIEGSGTQISSNTFTNNEAVPATADGTDGLGGAIYVKGDNTNTDSNQFEHNKARNGSAIYTDGTNFNLAHDTFYENQAWSYLLIVTPEPEESYYNESDVNITVQHIGGDNIINAIHNTAGPGAIHFTDVTSVNNGRNIYTGTSVVSPVGSAEASNNGQLVYQDDREYIQRVIITQILDEDGNNILNEPYEAYTNITGEIRLTIKKPIKPGNYTVYAEHPEDWNYKYIANTNTFRIFDPNMTVEKVSLNSSDFVIVNDTVAFNITVRNTGDYNLTNVSVTEFFNSSELKYLRFAGEGWTNIGNVFTYGNLTKGANATFTVWFKVLTNGTLINNVTAKSDQTNDTNDTSNVTVYSPNMTVEKISLNTTDFVIVNNTVAFNITVTNTGDCVLGNVTVTESFVDGELKYLSHSDEVNWVKSDNVFAYQSDLGVDESVTFTVYFKALTNGTLVNNVSAKSNVTNDTNDTANVTVYNPNMTVEKIALNTTVYLNNQTVFTIVVTNTGDCDLGDVFVVEDIPVGLTYDSYENVVGEWIKSGDRFNLVGILAPEEVVSFNIIFNATEVGNWTNIVVAGSNGTENKTTNNNTTVLGPNLDVQKLSLNKTVYVGNDTEFMIVVTNTGDCDLGNVTVTEVFDAVKLGYKDYTNKDKWTNTAENVFVYNGVLAPNESVNFTVIFTALVNGTLNNTVIAGSNLTENKTTNNTTVAEPICDLEIKKLVNVSSINVYDSVEWTIVVKNNGPSTAVDVVVNDTLPDGVEVIGDLPYEGIQTGSTIVWKLGDLEVNGTVTIAFVTIITVEGNNTNFVMVNTTTPDSNESNNHANNTTVANPICDLEITKVVNATSVNLNETVKWTITVVNHGPSAAKDVIVNDTIPNGLEFTVPTDCTFDGQYIIWNIGDLDVNASVTLELITKVVTEGEITNIVVVNSSTPDSNESNNKDNNTTVVNPICDLEITKLVNATKVKVNDYVEWTVIVVNKGPSLAEDVVVNDSLPEGLKIISAAPSAGSFDNDAGIWDIGNLNVSQSVSLVLVTQVLTNDTFINVVVVNSTTPDSNESNNHANNTTVAEPVCDVAITKLVNASNVEIGDVVEWTIIVVNNGPSTARDVVVTDTLPDGVKLVEIPENCKQDGNTVIWNVGDLNVDTPVSLTLLTQVLIEGNLTNVVVVNSTTPDSNESNNKANNTTVVESVCDLEIIKLVSAEKAFVGEELTWTIRVTNLGPSAAFDVEVFEDLPDTLKYIRYTADKGSFDSNTNIWTIGKLEKDDSVTLSIVTKVLSVGNITNPVEVTTSTPDSNITNNKANNTTEAYPVCDLEIIKSSDKNVYKVGDEMHWIIEVINHGPSTATEVVANDILSSAVEFIGFTASKGSYNASAGVWDIGELANGESVTLDILCKVLVSGKIENHANVTCGINETDLTNNHDNATVEVIEEPNIPEEPEKPAPEPETPVKVTLKETGNPIAYLIVAIFAVLCSFWSRKKQE